MNTNRSLETRFGSKRGNKRNLGGKSKNQREADRIWLEIGVKKLKIKGIEKTYLEWAVERVYVDAIQGKPSAQREFMRHTYGDRVILENKLGEGLKIIFEHRDGKGADAG